MAGAEEIARGHKCLPDKCKALSSIPSTPAKYAHTVEYYSATQKDKTLQFAATWMKLVGNISETNQA